MFQLPPGTLDTIEKANHYQPDDCLREVILRWLRRSGYSQSPPTWRWLVEVVGSPSGGNNPGLARTIVSQHSKGILLGLTGCIVRHSLPNLIQLSCLCSSLLHPIQPQPRKDKSDGPIRSLQRKVPLSTVSQKWLI